MMHGQKNIKLCNAEQAKLVHQYKNTKMKLYKNNAAIWYNKMCRARQLTPTYANIKIEDSNSRCRRTKDAAIRFGINQELRFQYAKKQQLNGSPLLTSALNGRLQSGAIPEAAIIQLDLLKMSMVLLETCRGS
jgi:hypothetical protein